MTKGEFLNILRRGLSQLPPEEVEKRLAYYEELLNDMTEDGMTEQEATAKLGDPAALAREILQEQPMAKLVKSRVKPRNGWTAAAIVAVVLGSPIWLPLLLTVAIVAISVYVVIGALVVSLFAVVLGIAVGGVALVFGAFFAAGLGFPMALLAFAGGLLGLGLSIVCFFGVIAAAKGLFWLTRAIFCGMKSLFIRKEAA